MKYINKMIPTAYKNASTMIVLAFFDLVLVLKTSFLANIPMIAASLSKKNAA
jgi:hypothetical protein